MRPTETNGRGRGQAGTTPGGYDAAGVFRASARAYVAVHLLLVAVWFTGGGGAFWPGWSMLGWGIGLALKARQAYAPPSSVLRAPSASTKETNDVRADHL